MKCLIHVFSFRLPLVVLLFATTSLLASPVFSAMEMQDDISYDVSDLEVEEDTSEKETNTNESQDDTIDCHLSSSIISVITEKFIKIPRNMKLYKWSRTVDMFLPPPEST